MRIDESRFLPLIPGLDGRASMRGPQPGSIGLAPLSTIGLPAARTGSTLLDVRAPIDRLARREVGLWHLAQTIEGAGARLTGPLGLSSSDPAARALAFKELAKFVDERGQLDPRLLSKAYPGEGWRVLEALQSAKPSFDLYGPSALGARSLQYTLAEIDQLDPKLATETVRGIWQIPESLPAIDFLLDRIEGKPFDGYVLFGVQHQLSSQAPLFSAFEKLGIPAEDIHLLGITYSTSSLMSWLFARKGYQVWPGDAGMGDDDNKQCNFHDQRLWEVEKRLIPVINEAIQKRKRVLILDDGGLAAIAVSKLIDAHPELAPLFKFVEQTTRGITEVSKLDVRWTEIDVATSLAKELETVHAGRSIARALIEQVTQLGIRDPHGVQLTVAGFGRLGAATARILRDVGFDITVLEEPTPEGEAKAQRARDEGFEATTDAIAAAKGTKIMLGISGHLSMKPEVLEALPPNAIVASGSSAEAEIAMDFLRNHAHKVGGDRYQRHFDDLQEMLEQMPIDGPSTYVPKPKLRKLDHFDGEELYFGLNPPSRSEVPHGQTQELIYHGKNLIVLNDGRPINFDGRLDNIEPEYIQLTRALMLLGALQAVATDDPGVTSLDRKKDPKQQQLQDDLLAWVQKLWSQYTQAPIEFPPAGDPPREPAVGEEREPRRSWQSYLSSLDEVFPRTWQARELLRHAVFRDRSGELAYVSLSEYGDRPFEKVRLPKIEGEICSFKKWNNGYASLSVRDDRGRIVEHFLKETKNGFLRAHARDKALAALTFLSDGEVVSYEHRRGRLIARSLDQNRVVASRDFPLDRFKTSFFGLESRSDEFSTETAAMFEVPRASQEIAVRDLGLRDVGTLAVPKDLVEVTEVCTSEGHGALCLVGKTASGRIGASAFDLKSGRSTGLLELPERSELQWTYYDSHRDRFVVTYRPPWVSSEVRYFQKLELVPPRERTA
jgi:hypothetical protein